jgi:HK97 family phage prohead protease
VIASTEDIDRSWEIIRANGWTWENFMKNPVIIANHVYKIENIVGKATDIYVDNNQLVIEWVFSTSNPLGILLADLYEEGMIKSVSVWFIPQKRDEKDSKIITEAELLELSFVAIPCNPNALSLDQKKLLEESWMIKEIKNEEVWSSSS